MILTFGDGKLGIQVLQTASGYIAEIWELDDPHPVGTPISEDEPRGLITLECRFKNLEGLETLLYLLSAAREDALANGWPSGVPS